jgi:hypothetical protein
MRAWLTTRKHIPPGTAAVLSASRAGEAAAEITAPADLPEGPAAALKRLERAEVESYRAFSRAVTAGDPVTVKTTRENWLRIVESLRKLDLQVGLDGRELIPKVEVEAGIKRAMEAFQSAMGRAFENELPTLCRGLEASEIAVILNKAYARFWKLFGEILLGVADAKQSHD